MCDKPSCDSDTANENARCILTVFGHWFALFVTTNVGALAWIATRGYTNDGSITEELLRWGAWPMAFMNLLACILCILSGKAFGKLRAIASKSGVSFWKWFVWYVFYGTAFLTLLFAFIWAILPGKVFPKVFPEDSLTPASSSSFHWQVERHRSHGGLSNEFIIKYDSSSHESSRD